MDAGIATPEDLARIGRRLPAEGHSLVLVRLSRRNDGDQPLHRGVGFFEDLAMMQVRLENEQGWLALENSGDNSWFILRDPTGALHAGIRLDPVLGFGGNTDLPLISGLRDTVGLVFDVPTANLRNGLGTVTVLAASEMPIEGTGTRARTRLEFSLDETSGQSPLPRGQLTGLQQAGMTYSSGTGEFTLVGARLEEDEDRIYLDWLVTNTGNADIEIQTAEIVALDTSSGHAFGNACSSADHPLNERVAVAPGIEKSFTLWTCPQNDRLGDLNFGEVVIFVEMKTLCRVCSGTAYPQEWVGFLLNLSE